MPIRIEEVDKAVTTEEKIKLAKTTGDWADISVDEADEFAKDMVLTTSYFVSGREIERDMAVITGECVFGMNVIRDMFANYTDFFGGRSTATQNVLRDARRVALGELKKEALRIGADAVTAIDLDYQELSGGGKLGMLMTVASGTAVKLRTLEGT